MTQFAGMERALVSKLVKALAGQKELYVQILGLAKQQAQHVAAGETEALMAVLAARSRLIEQVTPLDRELQPYKGRWQEVLDGLEMKDRQAVAGYLKEVQQLLADILARDEQDKDSLMRQKADIGSQLKKTVTGAALNRAYGVRK